MPQTDRPPVPGEGRRRAVRRVAARGRSRRRTRSRGSSATLARTPNRSRAVLGLARARRSGDTANSRAAYKRFLDNWNGADSGLPEIAEARAALGLAVPLGVAQRRGHWMGDDPNRDMVVAAGPRRLRGVFPDVAVPPPLAAGFRRAHQPGVEPVAVESLDRPLGRLVEGDHQLVVGGELPAQSQAERPLRPHQGAQPMRGCRPTARSASAARAAGAPRESIRPARAVVSSSCCRMRCSWRTPSPSASVAPTRSRAKPTLAVSVRPIAVRTIVRPSSEASSKKRGCSSTSVRRWPSSAQARPNADVAVLHVLAGRRRRRKPASRRS